MIVHPPGARSSKRSRQIHHDAVNEPAIREEISRIPAASPGSALQDQPRKIDQRKEPRRPAHGTVRISREGAGGPEIVGRLIDISTGGFRAAHGCATMTSGEIVHYSHAHNDGRARVVWTRVMGANQAVESGFMLVAEG